jgi:hypothetical protein
MDIDVGGNSNDPCKDNKTNEDNACKEIFVYNNDSTVNVSKSKKNLCADYENDEKAKNCRAANRCRLGPQKGGLCCTPHEQAHHLVEAHCFYERGGREDQKLMPQFITSGKNYKDSEAPCVCASGPRHVKEHGQYHAFQGKLEAAHGEEWTYQQVRDCGVKSHQAVNPQCKPECTEAQLDDYHQRQCGIKPDIKLHIDPQSGTRSCGELDENQEIMLNDEIDKIKGISKNVP